MFKLNVKLLLLFMCITTLVTAQEVTGVVTDDGGQPLPGVSVSIRDTQVGAITDFDGNYAIEATEGQTLIFSFVGFKTLQRTVSGAVMNVSLLPGVALEEVIVSVGSRGANRTVVETAVPIDVIDVKTLTNSSPQVNVNQILNYVAPSFTANTQTIADGTDHVDPASLRGLGPDQVLVLINGKRRHTSSLVNVNGAFGRGSVGTDLNAIPVSAIKRIEVLRDGAAAQYGSDAIAGVINIILNESTDELNVSITTGSNISKYSDEQTGGIDGETVNIGLSYGLKLGDKGGFINFSGDFDYRNHFSRMKQWDGEIFNAYNAIEFEAAANDVDLVDLATDLTSIQANAANVPHFSTQLQSDIAAATSITDLQGILGVDVTDAELARRGQDRTDYNMRVGQSSVEGGRFFANFSYPLDDEGTELYAFTGISSRVGQSTGFYRLPNQSRTYTPVYINGFLPEINSTVKDQSLAVGIKGNIGEWKVDFSNTYGRNSFDFYLTNTLNASLGENSPTSFDAGGFSFSQNTTNIGVSRFYEDTFAGLNVAFGGEYRLENYILNAGEDASAYGFDSDGKPIINDFEAPLQTSITDFFGEERPAASQVFPGFRPENALDRERSSVAGYVDIEADLTEKFLVSVAGRFEDYSDFGSTVNAKLAMRVKATDNLNIRAAANTGFRAPSLHQQFFNATSTKTGSDGNPVQSGTYTNDSRIAQLLGIPELKEETSKSVSVGLTAKIPGAGLSFTVDGYFVGIDDRIVYTGEFVGPGTGTDLDNLLAQGNADSASFFVNAIDTESKGLDVVITHKATLGENIRLRSDLSGTFSQTRKVGDIKSSDVLRNAGLEDTYFDEESRIYLEEAVPRTKVNLSNNLTVGRFNVFLRNVYFGEVTEANNNLLQQEVYSGKIVTDLSVGIDLTEAVTFTVGANNILDQYPDRSAVDLDPSTTAIESNRSNGRFDFSRRSKQFGTAGRYVFARVNFILK